MTLSICYPINQGKWYPIPTLEGIAEMYDTYPHPIRRSTKTGYEIIPEQQDENGYTVLFLNGPIGKHRVVATLFVMNDGPRTKKQVNHINFIRSDNRVENLEWVSAKMNMLKRQCSGIWVDHPPMKETLYRLQTYEGQCFFSDRIYFDANLTFYRYFDGKDTRACILPMKSARTGEKKYHYVNIKNDLGEKIKIVIEQFKANACPQGSMLLRPLQVFGDYVIPPGIFYDSKYDIYVQNGSKFEKVSFDDKDTVKLTDVIKNGHEIRQLKIKRSVLRETYPFD
jgi:hypothetical protein